jgi:hypothetical protein
VYYVTAGIFAAWNCAQGEDCMCNLRIINQMLFRNMCMPCSYVASALCAYGVHMLRALHALALSHVTFTICANCACLVRCCIHNMCIPCQMMHSQYAHTLSNVACCKMLRSQYVHTLSDVTFTICANCTCLVRCCIHNMCIPCQMMHSQYAHTLPNVAFTICTCLVRCCVHNMCIPCQMLHSQYAQIAHAL